MKTARYIIIMFLCACVCVGAYADGLSFNPLTKFRIMAANMWGSSVGIGMEHGVNTPLSVSTSDPESDDCYWYIQEHKKGQFALRNALTGEYITWDEVRSDNPMRRYLNVTATMKGDSSLWVIRDLGDDLYTFESVASEVYRFNVRSSSEVLGTYANSGDTPATNERFYIMKEDGSYYDQVADTNTVCGQDDKGLYWANAEVAQPVVMTTDSSKPVYYYIRNPRSQNWVEPLEWLSQSVELPEKRFYFVKQESGVQIMVEGGGYVSGKLTETSGTTDHDVNVATGSPGSNNNTWNINWSNASSYPGYSIGVSQCSDNYEYNVHIMMGSTYWNDYSSSGICWFKVDGGSTFLFYSKDERHRQLLAQQGLVIPGDVVAPSDTVVPGPQPVDYDELETIEGKVLHVYRTDGRVEAIPMQYVAAIDGNEPPADGQFPIANSEVSITTRDGGPAYNYKSYEVDSISLTAPEMPVFNSFKFNNKFNHHIVEDANGVFEDDTLITVSVIGIGKTLRPSYKLDDDVQAWIGDSLQKSKETRVRFDKDIVYTLARHGNIILRRTLGGEWKTMPYGRDVKVKVDFATDHSTGDFQVPTVYVTTDDGTSITSKSYYWSGKIRIDGGGAFPDMPETAIQIKGRGNSSWTTSGKAPYHFKFETSTKVLGLKKGKHWNLIANANTRSMTTNAIAMKMAQLVETAGFNHEIPVELYINGEYRGSYNLTEKVGLANNSIDLVDETYATLLELDSYYDEAYKFRTTAYSLPVNIKDPDISEGTTSLTLTEIAQNFNPVWKALQDGEDMSQYLDLEYLARFLFVDELSENYEFFHPKSTFLYNENIRDANSKYVFGPVWDFDWGYGYQYNGNYFTATPTNDYWTRSSMSASNWGRSLRYCGDNFNKIYYQLWHRFMTDGSLQELIDFCDDYFHFAAPSFTHDNTKWSRGNAQTYATLTDKSKEWLKKRAEYVYNYMGETLGYNELGYLDDYNASGKLLGDVNDDGMITTADLVCVLNYMLNLPNEEFEFNQADTDKNDIITVADLIGVRNLIVAAGDSGNSGVVVSKKFYSLPEAEAILSFGDVAYGAEGVSVPLIINVGSGDYSGLQFDLRLPEGMTLDNLDASRSLPDFDIAIQELETDNSQIYRLSLYSSAHHKMPAGKSELILDLGWTDKSQALNTKLQNATLANVLFATSLGEDERSISRSVEFMAEEPTGLNSAVALVGQEGNALTFSVAEESVLPVYGVDGRVYRLYHLNAGSETITLPYGVYIINKQKIIVR